MKPRFLPLTIGSIFAIVLGTVVVGVGIGLPQWIKTSDGITRATVDIGLFETCTDGQGCQSRDDAPGEIKLIKALCILGCCAGVLAFTTTIILLVGYHKDILNFYTDVLPWLTLMFSCSAGGLIGSALIIFENKDFDSSDDDVELGLAFVLTAAGGGCVVLGGFLFFTCGLCLMSYLRRFKEQEEQPLQLSSLHGSSMKQSKKRTSLV